jgi:hypothetical protein
MTEIALIGTVKPVAGLHPTDLVYHNKYNNGKQSWSAAVYARTTLKSSPLCRIIKQSGGISPFCYQFMCLPLRCT